MQTREYYGTIDKSDWQRGPWDYEPDKVQWQDAATGLPCLAVRNELGAWCGYVGVAEGHRYFGTDYNGVDVSVHGGLTFSEFCSAGDEARGICHVPDAVEPDHVWWLGFDCAHFSDVVPGMSTRYADVYRGASYKTLDYVRAQVAQLAEQLAR